MAKKIYIGAQGGLPAGYTRVEYIQSSGTQYIDTEFKPNQNTKMAMDAQLTDTNGTLGLLGERNLTGGVKEAFAWISVTGNLRSYFGTELTVAGSTDTERHIYTKDKHAVYIDGKIIHTHVITNFIAGNNAFIFATNDNNAATFKTKMKVYSCKIYDNGTLVRDFIPCKDQTGTVGLFDIKNRRFYKNAGTGTFVAGNDITDTPMIVANEVKKIYIGTGNVARKIKKVYIGVNGIAHEVFGLNPADIQITYTGNYTDEIVVMGGGKQYRLLTLISSGKLSIKEPVESEIWICGGGQKGRDGTSEGGYTYYDGIGGDGGDGAGFHQYKETLSGEIEISIGAGNGGVTSVGGTNSSGHQRGAGGGKGGRIWQNGVGGSAASMATKPFNDDYFRTLPCAGGGGGQGRNHSGADGGGGHGGSSTSTGQSGNGKNGMGGETGGGKGATDGMYSSDAKPPTSATYYGSGGGGGNGRGSGGANGYQGVVFVRIPI